MDPTTALVLRTIEFSETSLVVTLLTREFGRISALAKGARRAKGPFEGSLDLLAVCRVVVLRKSGDTLDLLTEAKLHRRFRGADRSLQRLHAGYYVAEMLRLLTDEHDPHPDLYDLALTTLSQIDGVGNVAAALIHFDLQALRMLGHSPGTDRCTGCGGPVTAGGPVTDGGPVTAASAPGAPRISFALLAGGIICGNCRGRERQTISMRPEVVAEMRRLGSAGVEPPESVPVKVYGELRAVLNRYIQALLGKTPRMQAYLPTGADAERSSDAGYPASSRPPQPGPTAAPLAAVDRSQHAGPE